MAQIRYEVALHDARAHVYQVTLAIEAPAAQQVVSLPAWIPGSYLVREFARHLSGLTASQSGVDRSIEQLDKASWRVDCKAGEPLQLQYRVYAFDNSVRAAWLDSQRGFFNGTGLCLRVHGAEKLPHRLALNGLPPTWSVATGMTLDADGTWLAADYDELVDHPFELGAFWQGSFTAGGTEHRVVISGALPSFDGERLLADSKRICEAQIAFWNGVVPFKHYTFMLNAVDEGYGGLEHRASTALIAPRRDLPRLGHAEQTDGYVKLLGLISHEYFHSWNVKRLRPAEFASYDYTQENYTELLWFFEGFTSYYDDLFLARAGLIDEARYLKLLSTNLSGVLATPGRKVQSLAQASFDAWVKYYRPDENTPNNTISYYGKGGLLALALDLSLRSAASPASLDALMRALWQRSDGGPISEADILELTAQLGGQSLSHSLREWVHGTDDLPLQSLLAPLGVNWRADRASVAQRLGLRASESPLTGVRVTQVLAGSSALAGGLCAGDEVLGCNGWRLRRLDDATATLGAAQGTLRLLVSRDQRLLELDVALPESSAGHGAPVNVSPNDKAPPEALGQRRAWLQGG